MAALWRYGEVTGCARRQYWNLACGHVVMGGMDVKILETGLGLPQDYHLIPCDDTPYGQVLKMNLLLNTLTSKFTPIIISRPQKSA